MNQKLPDIQAGFRKSRWTRDQIANICWIWSSKRISEKHLLLLHQVYYSLWLWLTTNWKLLKKMGNPDHLTCLLRKLYAGQEATVRTRHGTEDWFQTGKGVYQGCVLSPCLFNLYAEYIMRNTGLDETEAGIKIAGRNTNNLRYINNLRWHHPYGRKQRGTKAPLGESERGKWKSWLKIQTFKKLRSWHLVPSLHGK